MDMERIEEMFPRFDQKGIDLIQRAFLIAKDTLKDHHRSDGTSFIEHPVGVARIAYDEIGLPAECIAAVFLHEATRFIPEISTRFSPMLKTKLRVAEMYQECSCMQKQMR